MTLAECTQVTTPEQVYGRTTAYLEEKIKGYTPVRLASPNTLKKGESWLTLTSGGSEAIRDFCFDHTFSDSDLRLILVKNQPKQYLVKRMEITQYDCEAKSCFEIGESRANELVKLYPNVFSVVTDEPETAPVAPVKTWEGMTDTEILKGILDSIASEAWMNNAIPAWLLEARRAINDSNGRNRNETILYAWKKWNEGK